ncbi:MAG: hypothetical protein J2P57_17395 [Acidimicrobiaceae bacterium]|nr:hypothetical protein [Acidimicrobiaceae bacterium]
MPSIAALVVADPPAVWEDLGFVVEDGQSWVSGVAHRLGTDGEGVVAWTLRGADALAELPVADEPAPDVRPTPAHPNGVVALDHVVVSAPDLDRTIEAFEEAGVSMRRLRDAGTPERPLTQAFFKMEDIIVEVVGLPARKSDEPAAFAGLAFTVADLEATRALLGDRLRPAKAAVQRGRRIATLDRAAGSSVPIAFMSANTAP